MNTPAPTPGDAQSQPHVRVATAINHLLEDAARRAQTCTSAQAFLLYSTAIAKLVVARQQVRPLGPNFFAPTKTPTPEQLAYGGFRDVRGNFRAHRNPQANSEARPAWPAPEIVGAVENASKASRGNVSGRKEPSRSDYLLAGMMAELLACRLELLLQGPAGPTAAALLEQVRAVEEALRGMSRGDTPRGLA